MYIDLFNPLNSTMQIGLMLILKTREDLRAASSSLPESEMTSIKDLRRQHGRMKSSLVERCGNVLCKARGDMSPFVRMGSQFSEF